MSEKRSNRVRSGNTNLSASYVVFCCLLLSLCCVGCEGAMENTRAGMVEWLEGKKPLPPKEDCTDITYSDRKGLDHIIRGIINERTEDAGQQREKEE